jgi:hypothetical protein
MIGYESVPGHEKHLARLDALMRALFMLADDVRVSSTLDYDRVVVPALNVCVVASQMFAIILGIARRIPPSERGPLAPLHLRDVDPSILRGGT